MTDTTSADLACKFYDVGCNLAWVQNEAKGFFLWIQEQVFGAVLSALDAIPLPDWVSQSSNLLSGIPSGVAYFIAPFDIQFGLEVVASAYLVRFLIRRIPFIG